MCRVLLSDRKSILEYEKTHGLLGLLIHLELQCGGHGNGYALLRKGKIIRFEKGLTLSNGEIAKILLTENYDWVCWHTRIASIGKESDENCHPFVYGDTAIAMNGTEYDFMDVADALGCTDTEIVFRLMQHSSYAEATKILKAMHAVFVGFVQGKPIAIKNKGDLELWNRGTLLASSFPQGVPYRKLHANAHLLNGVIYEGKEPVVAEHAFSYFYSSYDERDLSSKDSVYSKSSVSYSTKDKGKWDESDEEMEAEYQWELGVCEGYRQGMRDAITMMEDGHDARSYVDTVADGDILEAVVWGEV